MTKEFLDKANELNRNQLRATEKFEEYMAWRDTHMENPEKELSFLNVGHGWISIPSDKKQKVLDLVHDILLEEKVNAKFEFENLETWDQ